MEDSNLRFLNGLVEAIICLDAQVPEREKERERERGGLPVFTLFLVLVIGLDSAPTAILQQDGVECNYMELIEYFQKKINLVICNKVKYN